MEVLKKGFILFVVLLFCTGADADTVNIGLNYPKTGPYSLQGAAQLSAAKMAVEEINGAGGILGKKVNLVIRDSESKPGVAEKNVEELIDRENCVMVFGGSSSGVAIAGGKVAKSKGKLYFGTLTYSNDTTGKDGHKYIFRECYNAWMGAKVLSDYLRKHYSGKKYFYIVADYTWGWTTEESLRTFSLTLSRKRHKRVLTPFPGATDEDFKQALTRAENSKADVLVVVLFGKDMTKTLTLAAGMGLKDKMAIVVPNLTLGMVQSAGPGVMEGVVGALPWCWNVPYAYGYDKGKEFVEKFSARYDIYPSTSAASAYTILYQYKDAVERSKSYDTRTVISALEGHKFTLLKDEQIWREFDHQCVQTVYAVKCKPEGEVAADKFRQDYFEIINKMPGEEAAISKKRWDELRKKGGKPAVLEW
ncbi:substrate-binding protein [Desulfococcaceae bacterium HSG8]|nr:substrate-binding protein [Desulfococcaceae bacterium HSG8]